MLRVNRLTLVLTFLYLAATAFAQVESASITGKVTDSSGALISGTDIEITSLERGTTRHTVSNGSGIYLFPAVQPGRYNIEVRHDGFRQIDALGLTVNVQDHVEENFQMQVGSSVESVTVSAEGALLNTQDAAVSTVVDRNFTENLPMNGRSFQTLIELTPGVVLTESNPNDAGQFSVNGQRADANYWMIDGVSANVAANPSFGGGNGFGGSLPGLTAQGGTNSLVSVDALQEFRIQTSTYAPEFGRTPGAQISILTRSGTNNFHGTLFDYLRNDALDANDWFADNKGLPKPMERQNDFGATVGGPLRRNRTFFFFSYEGLRLRLPQVAQTAVPDLSARQNAIAPIQPFLNAYPRPNGPEILDTNQQPTGAAQFNASFSDQSSLNATSIRIDHKINERLTVFGRFDDSPSNFIQRGFSGETLSDTTPTQIRLATGTVGSTMMISNVVFNDLRFNYSRSEASERDIMDNFGGAVPLVSPGLPAPFTLNDSEFGFQYGSLLTNNGDLVLGKIQRNLQRQMNLVDNLSWQRGTHNLKFGIDYRRLSPFFDPSSYAQFAFFADVPSSETGNLEFAQVRSGRGATLLFRNLGVFAQDAWRVSNRLTLTYGLRWDLDFAPTSESGPRLLAVTGFNLADLSQLALAPAGVPPFKTPYNNFAPRIGIAYQLFENQDWPTVIRGGFGVFYDLATQQVGNNIAGGTYPFGATNSLGGSFPLPPNGAAPPAIVPQELESDTLSAFDPHLKLPYTLQWSTTVEQGLGAHQILSASYVGSAGRRLIQTAFIVQPNPSFGFASLVSNAAVSDYDALQLQFRRQLSKGLQALASYTWSHSIDTASAGSAFGLAANTLVPGENSDINRGPSDFDVRDAFSLATTYDLPTPSINALKSLFGSWSIQNAVQARTALPVSVYDSAFFELRNAAALIYPDLIPGKSPYVSGPQCVSVFGSPCPGGKGFNPSAFAPPPVDSNGNPVRQGDLGRNALRGFGAVQWDFAVHREFPVKESIKLQFRVEMFNFLNHPNFGPPVADINNPTEFGRAVEMLGQSLNFQNVGGGGINPLYQIGGARSVQFALKLHF